MSGKCRYGYPRFRGACAAREASSSCHGAALRLLRSCVNAWFMVVGLERCSVLLLENIGMGKERNYFCEAWMLGISYGPGI